ncbi:ABC transporter substrate-binding protein [Nonomuraea antimicrobica]|uniref:ABC transporter substrate-binding protein n=1 Tax=Nonomuraea antimicrobica TaxID=561173 RepID=UPI0031F15409
MLAGAGALSGCAGGASTTDSPDWAAVAPQNASGKVTVWAWSDDQATVDAIASRFMQRYPKIQVTFKAIPYKDYTNALSAGLASGKGPDVFIVEPRSIVRFAPLSEDVTPLLQSVLGKEWQNRLVMSQVDELKVKDGRIVGLPNQANGAGTVLLNQGLLDQLGLSWPGDVKSIDELAEFCGQVKAKGKSCIGVGQDEWVLQDVYQAIANSIRPGVFTSAVQGKTPWTDPVLVKAFDLFQALFTRGVVQEGALGMPMYTDVDYAWQRGEIVAMAVGNWSAMNLLEPNSVRFQKSAGVKDPKPLRAQLLPFPAIGGNPVHVFATGYGGTAINVASKNKAAAAAWANWYSLDPEGRQKEAGNDLIGIPALKGVKIEPQGIAYPELGRPSIEFLEEEFANATDPRGVEYPELLTALETAFQQSASGTGSQQVTEELENASRSIAR